MVQGVSGPHPAIQTTLADPVVLWLTEDCTGRDTAQDPVRTTTEQMSAGDTDLHQATLYLHTEVETDRRQMIKEFPRKALANIRTCQIPTEEDTNHTVMITLTEGVNLLIKICIETSMKVDQKDLGQVMFQTKTQVIQRGPL